MAKTRPSGRKQGGRTSLTDEKKDPFKTLGNFIVKQKCFISFNINILRQYAFKS